MKKLLIICLLIAPALSVSAQKLIDIYKKGTVKLVPDAGYAQGNDWDVVFSTYYDTIYNTPMGNRKSLKIMPDGSVIVNHTYRNFYSKFAPDGRFEKEFGIINSKGVRYKKTNAIEGIINGNTFFTGLDNMGNMTCFDFNGNYRKTLKLDYMTRQMIPLPNNKIAVVGWVIWKDRFRDFVSIVDYETNNEKIIWEYFTQNPRNMGHSKLFNYSYMWKEGGAISITTMPFSKFTGMAASPQISCVENNLIVALPTTGEILIFDTDGNLKTKDKIGWATNYISVEEQKEIQKKAIEKYKKIGTFNYTRWVTPEKNTITPEENKSAYDAILKQMEEDLEKIAEPLPIPIFSTIIKDSDGNLLFFEFPKEGETNKFNVWIYENGGKFVCQSSFSCDDFNLAINPSKMVFYNGYIYSLQLLKQSTGVPLRLVRFKLTANA